MILLDTNVISELRRPRPHAAVVAWVALHPLSTLGLSAVSLYELQAGAERTRASDQGKADELDRWIAGLEQRIVIFPFDSQEARLTAFMMRKKSRDLLEDGMIAATALTHGLSLATRNTRDFETFGIQLINPFLSQNT